MFTSGMWEELQSQLQQANERSPYVVRQCEHDFSGVVGGDYNCETNLGLFEVGEDDPGALFAYVVTCHVCSDASTV